MFQKRRLLLDELTCYKVLRSLTFRDINFGVKSFL